MWRWYIPVVHRIHCLRIDGIGCTVGVHGAHWKAAVAGGSIVETVCLGGLLKGCVRMWIRLAVR